MPKSKTIYQDMLEAYDGKSGSEIIMSEWLKLWTELGQKRLPMGETQWSEKKQEDVLVTTTMMMKGNPKWTRDVFLARLVAWNNENNKKELREDSQKDNDCSIKDVAALRLHKAEGGNHGGDARISQMFGYGRKKVAMALGIHPTQFSRMMMLPPTEGGSNVGADGADYEKLLAEAGIKIDGDIPDALKEPRNKKK